MNGPHTPVPNPGQPPVNPQGPEQTNLQPGFEPVSQDGFAPEEAIGGSGDLELFGVEDFGPDGEPHYDAQNSVPPEQQPQQTDPNQPPVKPNPSDPTVVAQQSASYWQSQADQAKNQLSQYQQLGDFDTLQQVVQLNQNMAQGLPSQQPGMNPNQIPDMTQQQMPGMAPPQELQAPVEPIKPAEFDKSDAVFDENSESYRYQRQMENYRVQSAVYEQNVKHQDQLTAFNQQRAQQMEQQRIQQAQQQTMNATEQAMLQSGATPEEAREAMNWALSPQSQDPAILGQALLQVRRNLRGQQQQQNLAQSRGQAQQNQINRNRQMLPQAPMVQGQTQQLPVSEEDQFGSGVVAAAGGVDF